MPVLTDVPVEVFLYNLLPLLPIKDFLALTAVNKFLANIGADETLWKTRLLTDFNFSGRDTARTSGFKIIYKGLYHPRVFVWGEKSHGRLGLPVLPKSTIPDLPFPTPLHIPGVRIVAIVAGGMSFHALDSEGCLHVWGNLNGTEHAFEKDGFIESGKGTNAPLRLQMPAPIRTVSCGRLHSAALDANKNIWIFKSWGCPLRISSSFLRSSSIAQVECGWSSVAILTKASDMCVYWPFSDDFSDYVDNRIRELRGQNNIARPTNDGEIPCVLSQIDSEPMILPSIPVDLPKLDVSGDESQRQLELKVVRIGGMDGYIIALTNQGHVLKFGPILNPEDVAARRWEYLSHFCQPGLVRRHPAFQASTLPAPTALKITHISAHFRTFVAYSSDDNSVVLMGDQSTGADSLPNVIPSLQYKSVISVVLGDYHNAALTSGGKLLSWGAYSKGALGLGDPAKLPAGTPGGFTNESERLRAEEHHRGEPPRVDIPTEVRFDYFCRNGSKTSRFVVAACAAGWHSAALVIDLDPGNDDDEKVLEERLQAERNEEREASRRSIFRGGATDPVGGLPFRGIRGGPFRIGFAGRGLNPRGLP